ncbi:sensor histidine kinase [Pseudoxanthomonas sacheonensis]|uniref:sensor histidine kinase n=1 Tax=Pseudoxanthomonas sacheonensis TaxID=443615 RepID=UPI0013D1C16F|nr:ATP-binding protein [Pseudoxanthomonas sacheonensis]KAF1710967.1 two-component sensor histidine kinase [Pseudoxanthomonas sacheonensis]
MLASLLGVLTVLMTLAAVLSYRAGLQEAGEMFDARLVQSSRVLLNLVDEPLSDLTEYPGQPIVLRGWHGRAQGVGEALAFKDGHAYENKLAFQVWDAQGHLMLRSDSAPETKLAPLSPGYSDALIDGEQWRVFTLRSPPGRWFQSAERADIRQELAEDIAIGTLLPLLLALPLMALAIWATVIWAMRPLSRVSDEIGERDPERMSPLDTGNLPLETHGLVRAVNGLLHRLDAALARERQFIADAAHELRTPISALKVHACNAREAADASERRASQEHLDQSIARVERLVAQLLSLNRAERASQDPLQTHVDLGALVRVEIDEIKPLSLQKRQTIRLQLADTRVLGDELALGPLVRNLLENAIRYTPDGGTIMVSTSVEPDWARLEIEDSGPGIPEESRDRVFDRFHRIVGSDVEGSGLGLAIVRKIIDDHGGRITLGTSETLGGLAATVWLPRHTT